MRQALLHTILQRQTPKTLHKTPPHSFHSLTKSNSNDSSESNDGFNRQFQLHKSRGQHILTNPRVLDSIIQRSQILPTDTVLEIGPGTGNLTVRLLQSARNVIAIEIDDRMVDALQARVSNLGLLDRLTVIKDDALKTQLPRFDLCVANIPYGISSPLIAKLFFEPTRHCFRSATLLLQKEFAQRVLAKPGDSEFNRLAVNVNMVATAELLMNVSKRDFVPCPKVDSSLIRLTPRLEVPVVNLCEWLAFTRTCFGTKNKTLGAIFKQKKKIAELCGQTRESAADCRVVEEGSGWDEGDDYIVEKREEVGMDGGNCLEVSQFKEKIIGILKARGFTEKRPSKMSNEEFLDLLQLFNKNGVFFHH